MLLMFTQFQIMFIPTVNRTNNQQLATVHGFRRLLLMLNKTPIYLEKKNRTET